MAGRKIEHLGERIRQKLSTILSREAGDPRFQAVTISSVVLARDLGFAKVFFSCYLPGTDIESLTDSLNHASGFFSKALARSLKTRSTPQLRFVYDPGFDHAQRIDQVLDGLDALDSESHES